MTKDILQLIGIGIFLALVLTLLAGCTSPAATAEQYRPVIACELALATMADESLLVPPNPDNCDKCGGTGWITHGDGHETRCPDCYVDPGDPRVGGIVDTYKKAVALIDDATAILDGAKRDGAIIVRVQLPQPKHLADNNKNGPAPQVSLPKPRRPPLLGHSDNGTVRPAPPSPQNTTLFNRRSCVGGACLMPRKKWRLKR